MNTWIDNRLTEVSHYFDNGDYHLGYRRLLDAAIETNNFTVYEKALAFCDWYDTLGDPADPAAAVNVKVKQLLDEILNGYSAPDLTGPRLRLQAADISKQYARGNFSLGKISFSLHCSEIVGLVGENGNGKTTLLRLLNGELKSDTGMIKYHLSGGHAQDFYQTKSRIAFIAQRPNPWYGGLKDNLQFASSYLGLKGKENHLWTEMIIARMGLRPFRNYTWHRLSSGYKMRFELARALVTRPELLLLDEPLANLDILAQQIVLEDLKFLARSAFMPLSVMLTSQQLYEVEKVSDRIIFLQNGQARFQAPAGKEATNSSLVIELETEASREMIQQHLGPLGMERISFNGGVYILYFHHRTRFSQVLSELGKSEIHVKYLRDITFSIRRFFDA